MAHRRPPEAGRVGNTLPDLIRACPELQAASRVVVGFSGGLDSTVLLYLLHAARAEGIFTAPLHALHVNHALQTQADQWQEHCRKLCADLQLHFTSVKLPVTAVAGKSLEEAARDARYAAFAAELRAGELLALAQHRDDQVETVLFRLLRGSGPAGLAGMPRARSCGAGLLVRPLLGADRAELLSFAHASELRWIEDGSNADPRFDRNYLRGTVLPLLQERWPGLAGAVQRSSQLSGEAAGLLDELAANDVRAAAGQYPEQLRIDALLPLSEARQRNALRFWLQDVCARKSWALPTHQVLLRAISEVMSAAPDAEPLLTWGEGERAVELRRHRNALHVLSPLPPLPEAFAWSAETQLALPAPFGALELRAAKKGLPRARLKELRVCFRSGGELVKPAGRPTRPLKKILQEAGVPPWLRERIPLLYAGDELIAVADLLISEGWLAAAPENVCCVVWRHPDLDCGYPPHLLI